MSEAKRGGYKGEGEGGGCLGITEKETNHMEF